MTFSDVFKVAIIERQITRKWYNTELYLQLYRKTARSLSKVV